MASDRPLVTAARATAQLAAGCKLTGTALVGAIATFREISESGFVEPAAVRAKPADKAGPAPVINTKVRAPMVAETRPKPLSGGPRRRPGRRTWSWRDVDQGSSSTTAEAPEVTALSTAPDQAGLLRRIRLALKEKPIRLTNAASIVLARATGKAIGRDLVRKLVAHDDGRLQLTFGFEHGTATYVGEIDPLTDRGGAALEQLAECALPGLGRPNLLSPAGR